MQLPNLASRPLMNSRPVWLTAGVAMVVALALLALNLHLYFSATQTTERLELQRAKLEAQRTELAARVSTEAAALERVQWKQLDRKVSAVNQVLGEHAFSWLGLLADLGETLPWQVRLTRVSPSAGEDGVDLALKGESRTSEAVLEFLQNLIDSPHFEKPLPRSEESPESASGTGYTFTLKVRYLPEAGS